MLDVLKRKGYLLNYLCNCKAYLIRMASSIYTTLGRALLKFLFSILNVEESFKNKDVEESIKNKEHDHECFKKHSHP